MLKGLLLGFVIFASLGTFLIGADSALAAEQSQKEGSQTPPVAKEADQKPATSEDAKKKVEEAKKEDKDKPEKKPGCKGGMLTMGVGC